MTIEPNDNEDLAVPASCLRAGVGGTVAYLDLQGNRRTVTVTPGSVTYFGYRRILRTGTTAGELGNSALNPAYGPLATATGEVQPFFVVSIESESEDVSDGAEEVTVTVTGTPDAVVRIVATTEAPFQVSGDSDVWDLTAEREATLSAEGGAGLAFYVRHNFTDLGDATGAATFGLPDESPAVAEFVLALEYVQPPPPVLEFGSFGENFDPIDVSEAGEDGVEFYVSSDRDALVTLTAPAGFEVKTADDWVASADAVVGPQFGGAGSLFAYVRRTPASVGSNGTGNLSIDAPGADAAVTGVTYTAP